MALFDRASLVQIPSGYKEGKLYNIKPFDQPFEFERGSAATRVNEDGLIETFYDEATNLLLQSNQFDTTWTTFNATPTGGQSGYDGSSDAWLLNATGASGSLRQDITLSGVQTFSAYVKQGTADAIEIDCSITGVSIKVDLSDGSEISSGASAINTNIQSVGNDWYRISITGNGSATVWRMYVKHADNSAVGSGDNIYIQDAQLESGYFATPYIETTTEAVTRPNRHDTPRIDYTNGKSLLLEPQRTNLVTYSEIFLSSSTYYFGPLGSTIDSTSGLAPDGTNNASTMLSDGQGKVQSFYKSLPANTTYTLSVWVKNIDATSYETRVIANGGSGGTNITQVSRINEINTTSWTRVTHTFTTHTTVQNYIMYICNNVDSGESLQLWGAQLEQGSYATSYIPTNGQTETRLEDVCEGGGDESTFNVSEGTLYCELSALGDDITNRYIGLSDGTDDNRIILGFKDASNTVRVFSRTGATTQVQIDATYNITNVNKIALTYKSNDVKLWVNGSEAGSSTNYTTVSEFTTLNFDSGSGNSKLKANIKALAYFPEALTDTELQELTTI